MIPAPSLFVGLKSVFLSGFSAKVSADKPITWCSKNLACTSIMSVLKFSINVMFNFYCWDNCSFINSLILTVLGPLTGKILYFSSGLITKFPLMSDHAMLFEESARTRMLGNDASFNSPKLLAFNNKR